MKQLEEQLGKADIFGRESDGTGRQRKRRHWQAANGVESDQHRHTEAFNKMWLYC